VVGVGSGLALGYGLGYGYAADYGYYDEPYYDQTAVYAYAGSGAVAACARRFRSYDHRKPNLCIEQRQAAVLPVRGWLPAPCELPGQAPALPISTRCIPA